jgi:hypothetical protein
MSMSSKYETNERRGGPTPQGAHKSGIGAFLAKFTRLLFGGSEVGPGTPPKPKDNVVAPPQSATGFEDLRWLSLSSSSDSDAPDDQDVTRLGPTPNAADPWSELDRLSLSSERSTGMPKQRGKGGSECDSRSGIHDPGRAEVGT